MFKTFSSALATTGVGALCTLLPQVSREWRRIAAEALRNLTIPTLVIHGRDDTLLTPSGGERTAELIPGSVFMFVTDMGHDLPTPLWPLYVDAITSHARRAAKPRKGNTMSGPLSGYKILEIAGIGPGPFAAMMLADMGAEIIRVDRAQSVRGPAPDTPAGDLMLRGRRNIALDLKSPEGVEALLQLVENADAIIEGFRPGVMERLGAAA